MQHVPGLWCAVLCFIRFSTTTQHLPRCYVSMHMYYILALWHLKGNCDFASHFSRLLPIKVGGKRKVT